MADDPTPSPDPTPTPDPAPTMFDGEGNFTENWTHLLTDTTLHDNPTLKASRNIEALANQTVSAQKLVGMDKDRMVVAPNEASTELEWETFHKAAGRPETAADYKFARPEELPEEYYSQELATAAQELMHKLGLSQKQANALFEFNNNAAIAQLTSDTQDSKLAMTALKDGLYADWGNAYEQMKHDGDVAINKGAVGESPEFKARVVEKYGNDPDLTRLLANLGKVYRESGIITAESIPTPSDTQEEIDNITASKVYGIDYVKHGFTRAQHDTAVQKRLALAERMTKSAKTG